MDTDFFIILFGLGIGFVIGKILIDWAIGITPEDKDGNVLNFDGSPRNACSQHKWKVGLDRRMYCEVCKKIVS